MLLKEHYVWSWIISIGGGRGLLLSHDASKLAGEKGPITQSLAHAAGVQLPSGFALGFADLAMLCAEFDRNLR